MSVEFTPGTLDYLEELVTLLYQKEYFSWLDTSQRYVDEQLDDITARLPYHPHKPAPPHFNRYGKGMYYAAFKKSKHTEWYTFFTKYDYDGEIVYLIRYLTNNHVAAQHL